MLRVAGLNSAAGKIFLSETLQRSQRGPFLPGPAAPSVCGGVLKVELAVLQRDCSYLSQTNCLLPPFSTPAEVAPHHDLSHFVCFLLTKTGLYTCWFFFNAHRANHEQLGRKFLLTLTKSVFDWNCWLHVGLFKLNTKRWCCSARCKSNLMLHVEMRQCVKKPSDTLCMN